MIKTNAMRQLDKAHISYQAMEYDLGDKEFDGVTVTDILGLDYKECYKTLAMKHDHDIFLFVLAVDDEADLKKCAASVGVKNLEMVHVKDLLKEVGYQRGSVSPVGAKKTKMITFDDEIMNHEKIEISGGMKGVGLMVDRDEIVRYLKAQVKDITR